MACLFLWVVMLNISLPPSLFISLFLPHSLCAPPLSLAPSLSVGNDCPYIVDDPNEDTISVLVRLITEKKGTSSFMMTSLFMMMSLLLLMS